MTNHAPEGSATPRPLDRVSVLGLEVMGHHGVFASERRDGQVFILDLEIAFDTRPAAASDDLADTVDYGGLVASVVDAVANDPVDLIETLAQRVADRCLADRRVAWTQVTVHKPGAPIPATFRDVALTIRRSRDD